MRPFMFLCPNTGYIVQAQADDALQGENAHTLHLVSCASCGRRQLVDPVTAELAVGREPLNGSTWLPMATFRPSNSAEVFGSRSAVARPGAVGNLPPRY
jgi:hypothetical protein